MGVDVALAILLVLRVGVLGEKAVLGWWVLHVVLVLRVEGSKKGMHPPPEDNFLEQA